MSLAHGTGTRIGRSIVQAEEKRGWDEQPLAQEIEKFLVRKLENESHYHYGTGGPGNQS